MLPAQSCSDNSQERLAEGEGEKQDDVWDQSGFQGHSYYEAPSRQVIAHTFRGAEVRRLVSLQALRA